MKIGVLGTGNVGETLASKMAAMGHEVMMGSRTANNEKAAAWVKGQGGHASQGTFADTARFGEILFNCTLGSVALAVLRLAGEDALGDKILVDVANPLDFSKGMPPSLSICNTDSLGEQIQREYPRLRVVKSLNTMNCKLMVDPSLVPGDHSVFVCGNDPAARNQVSQFLASNFGWKPANIIDLGDITNARGTEALLLIWIRLMGAFKSPNFNFHIARAPAPVK